MVVKVAIIDADLIGRKKHRFPNLACMKLSSYYKSLGYDVELKLDYNNLDSYDKVTISKVFIDTEIPFEPEDKTHKNEAGVSEYYKSNPILNLLNVEYGGTGFYYDKSPKLPYEIEHIKPDYHLYDEWVASMVSKGSNAKDFQYYTDFSIGFTTRGCIRKCSFCVNQNYSKCDLHSPVDEFLDKDRPYICLLDDNIFASPKWKSVFDSIILTGKKFQYKQGLDERLLTEEKCSYLFGKIKWIGDRIFAFDNIRDREIIEQKLRMIRSYPYRNVKFYVLCCYNHDRPGYYDKDFWGKDITDLLERIKILMTYGCLPYIMRYKDIELSPYKSFYMTIARWCNQPAFVKKTSLREFAQLDQTRFKIKCASVRGLECVEQDFPEISEKYFDMKYTDLYKKS